MSIVGTSSQNPRFSPDSLPGLRLWLDAADRDSVVLSGSNVTQWNDKSGNLRNGTPVNGLTYSAASNAVVFTRASSQFLTLPDNTFPIGSSSFSIFFVFTPTSTAFEIQLITAGARGGNIFGIRSGNAGTGTLQTFWSGNNDIQTSNLWSVNQRNLGGFLYQAGGVRSLWINGVQGASDTPGAQTAITTSNCIGTLGSGAFNTFDGQMHEVLVFETSLPAEMRQQVEGYLARKWVVAPLVGHPYRFGGSGILPTDISGCSLWLDGADSTTMFQDTAGTSLVTSNGQTVRRWNDKSGRGCNATQAGNAPVWNSAGYATFAHTSAQNLRLPDGTLPTSAGTNAYSIFAVARPTVASRNLTIISSGSAGTGQFNALQIAGDGRIMNLWFNSDVGGGSVPLNTFSIMNANYTGAVRSVFLTGSNVNTTNSTGWGGTISNNVIGMESATNNWAFTGDIAELIVYPTALSTIQRQQVEGYLAWKWGINARLSAPASTMPYVGDIIPMRGFSPLDIDGLSLWLDAADSTTVDLSGTTVATWRDKSGNGNTATTAAGTLTHSSNSVVFTGSQAMTTTLSSVMATQTIFAVASADTSSYMDLLGVNAGTTVDNGLQVILSNNYRQFVTRMGGTSIATGGTVTQSTRFLYGLTYISGGNSFIYLNGSQTGSNTTSAAISGTGTVMVGAYRLNNITDEFYNGRINEVLIYNQVLTTSHRQQIETYLADKWGLRATMGGAHPSRYSPSSILPTQIAGCLIWLDAADSATFTLSGSNVTQWRDKSGNANHFSTLAGTSPTYSSNEVAFPSGGVMRSGASIALTLNTYAVIVFKLMQPSDFSYVLSFTSMSPGGFTGHYSIRTNGGILGGTAASPGNEADFGNATYFVNGTFNPSFGASTYSNRTVVVAAKNTNLTGTTTVELSAAIGRFFVGRMYEVILYSSPPTTTQRQQLEGYLAWKWGIQASLPGSVNPFANLKRALTAPFTPALIPGCTLWLDGADPLSLSLSGSNVTQWRDKSGSSNHYTNNGTVAYQSNGLYFNGSADIRNNTLTGFPFGATPSVSTFFVFSVQNVTSLRPLMSYGAVSCDKTGYTLYVDTDSRLYGTLYCGAASVNTGIRMNTTNIVSDVMTYTGTSGSITRAGWLNGAAMSTPAGSATGVSLSNWGITYIGAIGDGGGNIYPGWYFLGTIHEVLYFNRAVTASERRRIEGYLGWKWNLLGTLGGVEHPNRLSPAPILPTDIAGCVLWLDASDSATFTLSGSNVTQWRDKSGVGNHGTPTGTVTRTTAVFGGRSSVSFNGSTVRGSVSVTGPELTVIAVYQPNEVRGDRDQRVVSFANPGESDWNSVSRSTGLNIQGGGPSLLTTYRNSTMLAQSVSSHLANSPFIGCARYTGSAAAVFLNATEGTALAATSGNFGISTYGLANQASGSPETLNGHIAEVIVYTVAITTTQRQQLESYLAWKWGIQSVLPSASHPYRTFKP
jgi:hypothetical protein